MSASGIERRDTGAPQVVPAQQAVVTAGRATGLPRTVVEMARELGLHACTSLPSVEAGCTDGGEDGELHPNRRVSLGTRVY